MSGENSKTPTVPQRRKLMRLIDANTLRRTLNKYCQDRQLSGASLDVAELAVIDAPTIPQWTKINGPEDLPPIEEYVLVIWSGEIAIGYVDAQGGKPDRWHRSWPRSGCCDIDPKSGKCKVSHWTPMPEPPGSEEK